MSRWRIDAITFAVSAVLLRIGLIYRPAVATVARHGLEQIRVGFRTVAGDRRLRLLLALAWLAGFWTIPEGLAAPYASAHGGGPTSVGILLAANPAGNLIGVLVLTRWVPTALRPRLLGLLAIASGVPLMLCGFGPGIAVSAVLWGICGLLSAYLVLIVTEFVAIVPPNVRGQAIGLASSGLLAAQGIGLLIGGGIASVVGGWRDHRRFRRGRVPCSRCHWLLRDASPQPLRPGEIRRDVDLLPVFSCRTIQSCCSLTSIPGCTCGVLPSYRALTRLFVLLLIVYFHSWVHIRVPPSRSLVGGFGWSAGYFHSWVYIGSSSALGNCAGVGSVLPALLPFLGVHAGPPAFGCGSDADWVGTGRTTSTPGVYMASTSCGGTSEAELGVG